MATVGGLLTRRQTEACHQRSYSPVSPQKLEPGLANDRSQVRIALCECALQVPHRVLPFTHGRVYPGDSDG